MSNEAMKLTLAAAVATAAASLVYATAFGGGTRNSKSKRRLFGSRRHIYESSGQMHFDVPSEILNSDECECKEEIVLAVQLALEAGKNMTQHYNSKGTADENIEDLDISTKSNAADFATAIDVMNENYIQSAINEHFPTHKIIGEEAVGTGRIPPLTTDKTWIIDPIDGTTNFASGLPLSCVSIGFCKDGKPYMGVVFAPMTNELYIAVRGLGAYRNGIRLLPCTGEKATKTLSHAVVCFEFGYARDDDAADNMVNAVRRLLKHGVRTTRTLGSGVLDICYVACGRMDVVFTGMAGEGWKPWDYCAALVVAMECGCYMGHLRPEVDDLDSKTGKTRSGYDFNMYSKTMICAVNEDLATETQKCVLGL